MKSRVEIKKLPSYVLAGSTPISRPYSNRFRIKLGPDCVSEYLGVRRINETCLEIFPGARSIKSAFSSAIGVLFLLGVASDVFILTILPGPYPIDIWLTFIFMPFLTAAIGGLLYLMGRGSSGSPVRISRKTGKIYYVIPDEFRLVTLDWQEMQPMAGNIVVSGGAAGHTVFNPLFLVGVDWTQSPPREAAISCGNVGWRDNGKSACELFSYIQHFMDYGPQGLPMPGPPPPKMSRKDTFLYGYREWAKKYREDLSTPKGKRWAVLWAPAKVCSPTVSGPISITQSPRFVFPKKTTCCAGSTQIATKRSTSENTCSKKQCHLRVVDDGSQTHRLKKMKRK